MRLGGLKARVYGWLLPAALVTALCFGLTIVKAEEGGAQNPTAQSRIIEEKLKNGLTILVKPSSANQVVTVDAFIRMGALYETMDQRGISALMQRVLTKGTTTRGARDIAFTIESAGSTLNANIADYHYGRVSLRTTLSGMETGMKLFLDVMSHPTFPEAEVAKEKQI